MGILGVPPHSIESPSVKSSASRAYVIAIVAAAGLFLMPLATASVEAASCNGASHVTPSLTNGKASPGSGSPTTTIRFSVRYRDSTGCAPTRIQVVIPGVGSYRLRGGTAYQTGVTFSVGIRLPVGKWAYRFTASSGSGAGARSVTLTSVSPSRVVITKPKPKPAPKPAPKPTPRPTAKPAANSKPKPSPTASTAPGAPSSASADPDASAGVGANATGAPSGTSGPGPGAVAPGDLDPAGGSEDPAGATALSFGSQLFDLSTLNAIQVWSMTSALGVLLFAIALRRLAPGEPAPAGSKSWRSLRSTPPVGRSAPAAQGATTPTSPGEAHLPRWLRPSLRAERHAALPHVAEPVATHEPREPIRFTSPPSKGVVRSTVAYRLVRVTDGPDDHMSVEIGRLDRGDEVEVIGDREGYLKVRTPTGLEGWIPRMVLVG
jgi:hypothetical protein